MYIALNDYTKSFYIEDEIVVSNSGNNYEISERIGSGGNGAVYECIDKQGNVLAIKFLLRFSNKSKKRFAQEINILKQINNPHIIKYIDDGLVTLYDSRRNPIEAPFLIMEKADYNLAEYIKNEPLLEYEFYSGQFRGLCEGLSELHNIAIHRDIKPENILIKADRWFLSDFGLSQFLDPTLRQDITGENEKVGPLFWISPEAVTKYYFDTEAIGTYSDVYQLCLVFLFVITKTFPGGILSKDDIINTTDSIKDLLLSALSNNPKSRPHDGKELLKRYNESTYNN